MRRSLFGRANVPLWVGLALAIVAWIGDPAAAQGGDACAPVDIDDETGDLETDVPGQVDPASGLNRVDLDAVCIQETATAINILVQVAEAIDSSQAQTYSWSLHLRHNGTDSTFTVTHSNAAEDDPGDVATINEDTITYTLAKADFRVGSNITNLFVESAGTFVPQVGETLTATDRAPDAGSLAEYVVGARAPAGTDTDGDALDDADEIENGTDPNDPDTDNDGLTDGEEIHGQKTILGQVVPFGPTNATRADTDQDGLSDGQEVLAQVTVAGQPVSTRRSNPINADSDGDGVLDGEEVFGTRNTRYRDDANITGLPGSTHPTVADTDGDGLSDGEEIRGLTVLNGQQKQFSPTNPNDPDTDGDGLNDLDEVRGLHISEGGVQKTFPPTDPTKEDTDGDGASDFDEVRLGHDPTDPDDKPITEAVSEPLTYLPLSGGALILLILVCAGGILWRWG